MAALTLQWYSRVNHVTDMPLLYTFGLLGIHQKYFKRLSAEDQKVVHQVLESTFDTLDSESRKENLSAFEAIQQQGLEVVAPTDAQFQEWKQYADRATAELVEEGEITQGMLDRLNAILAKQREGQK